MYKFEDNFGNNMSNFEGSFEIESFLCIAFPNLPFKHLL